MRFASLLACLLLSSCATGKVVKLVMSGDETSLRSRPEGSQPSSPGAPPLMLLALDGIERDLLYSMLKQRELPNLALLLGPDPYLDDSMLSTLPSTTMPAWVTTLTGVGPAEHGVTGNEYFIRETQTFACPAPVSFNSMEPTLAIFTDRYLDKLVEVPTVYERMRKQDPDVLIWVAMNHLFRGADKLLMAKRTLLVKALMGMVVLPSSKTKASRNVFEALDVAAIDAVVDHLGADTLPDVLTVYLSGTDLYAHIAHEGPDDARRAYLREVVDPALGKLVKRLRERGVLERQWTMVIADHGHTEVVHDEPHALGTQDAPVELLKAAGFRVRPFKQEVAKDDPYSAVLAYGGAMAYVYLADRSQCVGEKDVCFWKAVPRYKEDVLAAAEAFHKNNADGSLAPKLKGALDMILTRKPKPFADVDVPFEVYIGDGRTMSIEDYLKEHPHPTYVALAERMKDLAVGSHGERAGDILLLAHNGNREQPQQRFYFASEYRSWHGSPSKADSEIPLIVANHHHRSAKIGAWVRSVLGARPSQQKITDLMLGIRAGAAGR